MKISQCDILMVPGYTNADPGHWQSRWQRQMKTARRVEQQDWLKPVVEEWTANLLEAIDQCSRPIVLVAHSLGDAETVDLRLAKALDAKKALSFERAVMVASPESPLDLSSLGSATGV